MDLLTKWQKIWHKWRSPSKPKNQAKKKQPKAADQSRPDGHQPRLNPEQQAADSLRKLLNDDRIPEAVRQQLAAEYQQLKALIDKLDNSAVHIVAFGKVSTGKSSLLNALSGTDYFSVSPLHGETRHSQPMDWPTRREQAMVLIDTPGTDELGGEEREHMAREAARLADVMLFVVDGDVSASELQQLQSIANPHRLVIVVINKADLYAADELASLVGSVKQKLAGLCHAVVTASADPRHVKVIKTTDEGEEVTETRVLSPDIASLKQALWQLLDKEGKSLTAINASLFAGQVSDQIAEKIVSARSHAADKIIRTYCIAKGVGVAFNPIPVADLLVAAGVDVAMVRQLSKLYGLPMGRAEAARLAATIMAQLALLMGAVWSVNLLSSALKTVSVGLSTSVTAVGQGSLAYYATYLVGKIATQYFKSGYSWGDDGPKKVAQQIVRELDRDSILREARNQILSLIKNKSSQSKN